MVPDSLVGLALFIALLTPGFVYLETRERRHPGVEYSTLRETSLVVVTSVVSLAIASALAGLIRALWPDHTPDVGAYVRDGGAYFKDHYAQATLWSFGVIAVACVVARLWAVPPAFLGRIGPIKPWIRERRGSGVIGQMSGWGAAFDVHRDERKVLEVVLTDGTSLFGTLGSRSTQIAETMDRDLVLTAPIMVRESTAKDWTPLDGGGTIVVSAARIKYMLVCYEVVPSSVAP
jgi:hypothetical protein